MKKYIGTLAIVLLAFTYSMESHSKTDTTQLAKCLTKKGWVMYEADGCKACAKQRRSFGAAFSHIKTVECGDASNKCNAHDINYTPTWLLIQKGVEINRLVGNQSLDKLANVSGCG